MLPFTEVRPHKSYLTSSHILPSSTNTNTTPRYNSLSRSQQERAALLYITYFRWARAAAAGMLWVARGINTSIER